MGKLQFDGDITIDEIFKDHKFEIYEIVLKSIKESYLKSEITELNVVKIYTQSKSHTINLARNKFIAILESCIEFFEPLEEYEKCQECIDLICEIELNLNKQNN